MSQIILIGASVRALAESARRAGYRPLCVDLFRDADLLAHHPDAILCPIDEYPWGFARILETLPPLPVIYTGGLENYPEVIGKIAERHRIFGISPDDLRRVRDPFLVRAQLTSEGFDLPELSRELPEGNPGGWLRKPFAGSAGRGIRPAVITEAPDPRCYFQKLILGRPFSALFIGAFHQAILVGASEQLIGCEWLNAEPYWYCGNVGPVSLSGELLDQIKALGAAISRRFRLTGCFGIDLIVTGNSAHLIEINPRYTASSELYEKYWGGSLVVDQMQCFASGDARNRENSTRDHEVLGKAVWHTPQACRTMCHPQDLPPDTFADLPHHGQQFGAHEPFVTIFAKAIDRETVVNKLQLQAARIPKLFQLEMS